MPPRPTAPAHHAVNGRDGTILDNTRERPALVTTEFGWVARRLAVDQPVGAKGVEPKCPVANRLQPDAERPLTLRMKSLTDSLGGMETNMCT